MENISPIIRYTHPYPFLLHSVETKNGGESIIQQNYHEADMSLAEVEHLPGALSIKSRIMDI